MGISEPGTWGHIKSKRITANVFYFRHSGHHTDSAALRKSALEMSKRLRHRGPDWSGVTAPTRLYPGTRAPGHRRSGQWCPAALQPGRTHVLAVNGEIYNHKELEKNLKVDFQFQFLRLPRCCSPLKEKGPLPDDLNGIFAFILYDAEQDAYLIGRDHMGIIPYTGRDEHGNFYVASEMKALVPVCKSVETFPPGHYHLWSKDGELKQWYKRDWMEYQTVEHNVSDKAELKARWKRRSNAS